MIEVDEASSNDANSCDSSLLSNTVMKEKKKKRKKKEDGESFIRRRVKKRKEEVTGDSSRMHPSSFGYKEELDLSIELWPIETLNRLKFSDADFETLLANFHLIPGYKFKSKIAFQVSNANLSFVFGKSVYYGKGTNRGRSESKRVIAACSSNQNCTYMVQAKLIDNWWTIDKVNANHTCGHNVSDVDHEDDPFTCGIHHNDYDDDDDDDNDSHQGRNNEYDDDDDDDSDSHQGRNHEYDDNECDDENVDDNEDDDDDDCNDLKRKKTSNDSQAFNHLSQISEIVFPLILIMSKESFRQTVQMKGYKQLKYKYDIQKARKILVEYIGDAVFVPDNRCRRLISR